MDKAEGKGVGLASRRRGRGAPVPGRSNVRKHRGLAMCCRAGHFGSCCAQGRAHSGGKAKMRAPPAPFTREVWAREVNGGLLPLQSWSTWRSELSTSRKSWPDSLPVV
jgi:hypothetical protein